MPLDKAIEHGKEHRKAYHGAKAIDRTCRNHGGCQYCQSNRLYQYTKCIIGMKEKLEEFRNGDKDEY